MATLLLKEPWEYRDFFFWGGGGGGRGGNLLYIFLGDNYDHHLIHTSVIGQLLIGGIYM